MERMAAGVFLLVMLGCGPKPPGSVAATVPPEHWGRNLVGNAGFEADADGDGQPDGWNLVPGCAWDAAERHGDTHALRFTNTDKASYRLITAPVALIPGLRYRISAWVKGSQGGRRADGRHRNPRGRRIPDRGFYS